MVAHQYRDWQPHLTVAVVASNPENPQQFLCVQEYSSTGQVVIGQPSGHVEYQEDILAAAVRETLEETAYLVEPTHFIALQHWQNPRHQAARAPVFFRVVLAAKVIRHLPERPLDKGIIRCMWLSSAELDAKRHELRAPHVLDSVLDYQNGNLLPLSCIKAFCNAY